MKLLLDTHILLWMTGEPQRLSHRAETFLTAVTQQLFFSPVSLFEVAAKSGKRRSDFFVDTRALRAVLLQRDVFELPLYSEHTFWLTALPDTHKDPFDRLLLAQAAAEDMLLLTVDSALLQYPAHVLDAR